MIVCNSTLYMTEYVLSKLTFILQAMARLLSLHDLCYAPKRVQLDVIFRSTFFLLIWKNAHIDSKNV